MYTEPDGLFQKAKALHYHILLFYNFFFAGKYGEIET